MCRICKSSETESRLVVDKSWKKGETGSAANGYEIGEEGIKIITLQLYNGNDCSFVNILLTICPMICKYISPL